MDSYLKEALGVVKVQASVKSMTPDEILSMTIDIAEGLRAIVEGNIAPAVQEPACDPKNAIREKYVVCLECGEKFKVLTKRHLIAHGLTPAEYREKWGYKKDKPLVCKSLARARRKKMSEMRLWERRSNA